MYHSLNVVSSCICISSGTACYSCYTLSLQEDKNKSLGKPSRPPKVSEPRAPPTASLPPGTRSLYQPLAPVPSTYNGGSLYEDLNKVTRDAPKNNDRFKVPSRPGQRDPTYMGLNPHTQVASEVYMGLDEARSWTHTLSCNSLYVYNYNYMSFVVFIRVCVCV